MSNQNKNLFISEDEESRIITYEDGIYMSQSLVDYDFEELWNDYENQVLLIELYYQNLTENQLCNIFKKKMSEYFQHMAKEQNIPIQYVFSEYFNPYDEEECLNRMRDILRTLSLYDFIIKDIKNLYLLNPITGKEQVEKFLAKKHEDKWMFFKMMEKNKYKDLNMNQIIMKWMEITIPDIDQLLYLFNPPHSQLNFNQIINEYGIYLKIMEKDDINNYDPELIKKELIHRLNSLMELGLLAYHENMFVLTKNGFMVISRIKNDIGQILVSLINDHIIYQGDGDDNDDNDIMKLTNNGERICEKVLNNIYSDMDRLLERPKYSLNGRNKRKIGRNAPLYQEVRKRKERKINEQVIDIDRTKIDGWRQNFVKITSSRINMIHGMLCISLISFIFGLVLLKLDSTYGLTLLSIGGLGMSSMMLLSYLRRKWSRSEYYLYQLERQRMRRERKNANIERIRKMKNKI